MMTNNINTSAPLSFQGLNSVQKEAVGTVDGPLLVIAGAGSGKTKVLTQRVAYLIEKNVRPGNILSLTFTNKAAEEMKQRIARIVSPDAAQKVWAGTFHSIFARVLRREADNIGYTHNFSIYDTDETNSAIKSIMNTLGISQQQFNPNAIRSRISKSKNQMLTAMKFMKSADNVFDHNTGLIYEQYEKHLKICNAMDFDDLIMNFIYLMKNSAETLNNYQDLFKYILVDEYQDTNKAQYTAINLLGSKHKNVCVVGDDAQSIYRWRGADIRNILDFQKDYPKAKLVRLEQNYRSTKTIIGAADSVIKNNKQQIQKKLWTENPDGELIEMFKTSDELEEAERIVLSIKNNIKEKKLEPTDFALLYRTNAQSLTFENNFRKHHIPYTIIGSISFYKRKEVKDALAYLKLLVNPKDSESILRIINEPPRGIGQTSIKHLIGFAAENSLSMFETFQHVEEISELQNRAKNVVRLFKQFIDKFIDLQNSIPPIDLINQYISETGLLQMYNDIGTDDSTDRLNNIQQLLDDLSNYFMREQNATLEDYLQKMSLASDIDMSDISQNQVKLMTIHSSKGLEFPYVYIAGLEQGLFPLANADFSPDEEEEERRLFYVAITRAKEKLYISTARRRMRFGQIKDQIPSMFIGEIDKKYLKNSSPSNSRSDIRIVKPTTGNKSYFINPKTEDNYSQIPVYESDLQVGTQVKHKMFGQGKIVAMTGDGVNKQVLVDFRSVGRKRLILQYANLEIL